MEERFDLVDAVGHGLKQTVLDPNRIWAMIMKSFSIIRRKPNNPTTEHLDSQR